MRGLFNETINEVRIALRTAIHQIQLFDETLTEREAFDLLVTVAKIGGVPPSPTDPGWHDQTLYEAVRKKLGDR